MQIRKHGERTELLGVIKQHSSDQVTVCNQYQTRETMQTRKHVLLSGSHGEHHPVRQRRQLLFSCMEKERNEPDQTRKASQIKYSTIGLPKSVENWAESNTDCGMLARQVHHRSEYSTQCRPHHTLPQIMEDNPTSRDSRFQIIAMEHVNRRYGLGRLRCGGSACRCGNGRSGWCRHVTE